MTRENWYTTDKTFDDFRARKNNAENRIKEILEEFEKEFSIEVSKVNYTKERFSLPMPPGYAVNNHVKLNIDF